MDSQQTFSRLLEELDYASSPNLISKIIPQEKIPAELEVTWREAKDKLGIDAVYFIANAPVIYFKQFETYDQREIAELHRNVWSQSKIPLLFIVLPHEVRVYSGYEAPKRAENEFGQPSRLENDLVPQQKSSNALWERLKIFTRMAIDSGSFWRDYGDKLHKNTRADQTLIANLRYIRRELIKAGLSPEHSHSLIGRSIFALYLQDRSILSTEEQRLFAQTLKGGYTRYTDLLSSYEDTYTYFEILREHFNGDMFPVTKEEKEAVQPEHLNMLRRLFTVDSASGGQMLFFGPITSNLFLSS